jgi:hypothetical protein
MPTKQTGLALAAFGVVLVVGSFITLYYPDNGKWFPVLLVAGGAALWFGINKYRWAR